MKQCIIIKGFDDNIEEFENQLTVAFEQGYELSGDLITHVLIKQNDISVVILLQPMSLTDDGYSNTDNF